uniref:CSON006840 protein n=1 Tax=Culicoides sonorensis TaxID=179676 RepID=A0A336MU04_CULSO
MSDTVVVTTIVEDLLIHGDSVYDIIDKQDHGPIQAELGRSVPQQAAGHHHHPHHHSHLNHHHTTHLDGERRMFLCRMNVSRNARRQMRFGDQKVRFYLIEIDLKQLSTYFQTLFE